LAIARTVSEVVIMLRANAEANSAPALLLGVNENLTEIFSMSFPILFYLFICFLVLKPSIFHPEWDRDPWSVLLRKFSGRKGTAENQTCASRGKPPLTD
jgi:hypothetical protein